MNKHKYEQINKEIEAFVEDYKSRELSIKVKRQVHRIKTRKRKLKSKVMYETIRYQYKGRNYCHRKIVAVQKGRTLWTAKQKISLSTELLSSKTKRVKLPDFSAK